MPRYTPSGKRIVNRPVKSAVPGGLLAAIDAQAGKVLKLRGNRDDLEARVSQLDHAAYQTRAAAGQAADRGTRKRLHDQADTMADQASAARSDLDRARQAVRGQESVLAGLHSQARAWQCGDHQDDQDEA